MLKQLTLSNFEGHKQSVLHFAPGVNAIVGPTDSGKSAIIHGMRWVQSNRPSGDEFIRHGEVKASVAMAFEDVVVLREKSRYANFYQLDDQKMEAMGLSVPEAVAKAVNMDQLNFQGQYDAPYMLSSTGGEVSKELNEAAGLSDMDDAMAAIVSMQREAKRDKDRLLQDFTAVKLDFKRYDGVDAAIQLADAISEQRKALAALNAEREFLASASDALDEAANRRAALVKKAELDAAGVEQTHSVLESAMHLEQELRTLKQSLLECGSIAKMYKLLAALDPSKAASNEKRLSQLQKQTEELQLLLYSADSAADKSSVRLLGC